MVWRAVYAPWEASGELTRAVRGLANTSEHEVLAFYRRYGPLGYPAWTRLGGEPLGWAKWQARRFDFFALLVNHFNAHRVEPLRGLFQRGVRDGGSILLPDATPGAIEIPCMFGASGDEPPVTQSEVMRAVRVAIERTLQESVVGVRIRPVVAARRVGTSLQVQGTLAWEIPTLLEAVYLTFFLGYATEAVTLCEICGTPYFQRGDGQPPTCSPRCTATRRQRKKREKDRRRKRGPRL